MTSILMLILSSNNPSNLVLLVLLFSVEITITIEVKLSRNVMIINMKYSTLIMVSMIASILKI